MTWLRILLTVLFTFGTVTTLSMIDQPRKPTGAGEAILATIINAGVIWAVWVL